MYRVKRIALTFTSLIFLIVILCQAVYAVGLSTDASLYLSGYGASMYKGSANGSVRIDYTVTATDIADLVGVSELVIYNANGSRAATITGTVENGLLRKDAVGHMSQYTYYGDPGAEYYARLTMYAKIGNGSASRNYFTNIVTAPGTPTTSPDPSDS